MPAAATKYRFGPYEVRVRTHELYKQGTKVKLRPQPFQVLQLLVERAPDVVSREELRQKLWSSGTFVDFEHGLNAAVKELRGVLCDSASDPRYIETLPRLGYHIIVPVEAELAASEGSHSGGSDDPATVAGDHRERSLPIVGAHTSGSVETSPVSRARDRWPWLAGALGMILVSTLAAWLWPHPRNLPPAADPRLMLAVLPFENLTGDPAQDYFSDGLTEEMISQLGRLDPQHLSIIARTSAMHYKNTHERLDQIGRELGVDYVLEGSVRRDGNNVRISAQLIRVKDQTHLWAQQYDRELSSVLAVQSEIAQEVADATQLALGTPAAKRPAPAAANLTPSAVEAYDSYLQGRYFLNLRNSSGFRRAAEHFQHAIDKDPNYAPAYAGLADTYALMGSYYAAPPSQVLPQARTAALKALQLDDRLAEAHTSLALITENYDLDWRTAEQEFRRAIELNPNYATAHHWYAELLMWLGRFDEALQESDLAKRLDPLSIIIATDRGAIFYYARQYHRTVEQLRWVLAIDPNVPRATVLSYAAYLQTGQSAQVRLSETDLPRCATDAVLCGWLAYAFAREGRRTEALQALNALEHLGRSRHVDAAPLILAHIALGRTDDVFKDLNRAYAEHSNILTSLKVDPLYDPLRSDPRFQALLHRVGLDH